MREEKKVMTVSIEKEKIFKYIGNSAGTVPIPVKTVESVPVKRLNKLPMNVKSVRAKANRSGATINVIALIIMENPEEFAFISSSRA